MMRMPVSPGAPSSGAAGGAAVVSVMCDKSVFGVEIGR
jgi:hypothetical protein